MRWKSSQNNNGHGYKFYYDNRNRLTEGRHTYYNFEDYPVLYNERISYNRNSSITQLTRWESNYTRVDSLFYGYNGNRLSSITDFGTTLNYSGHFEFRSHTVSTTYTYNGAGDLTQDGNKGLTLIQYDYLGHPVRVQFSDGSCTEYVYAADGRKLREKHTTAVEGLSVAMGSVLQLTPVQTMAVDSMDYADNLRYRRQHIDSTHDAFNLDYHFDGGYLSVTPTTSGSSYNKTLHFFICDHQGNTRLVVDGSDNIKQTNEYYPYGGPWGGSNDQGFQPYKYNGKELDRVHGLDWYDYGARRYDPAYCLFTQIDPLAEKYPHLNPYVYCAGNPVRYVDPDGMDWYENEEGKMVWTDHISQKGLDDNNISGKYMGKVVLVFNGSRNEKLGKGESLFGEGAVLAKATLYGRDGADDITEFDGFTMSSDFKTFGAIDDGEYNVNYKNPGKGGSLSSHWAINDAGPVDCLDGKNPNPFSAYNSTQKAGVYIHRSNNNGWAGTNFKKKTAVSTGCLLIVPSKYDAYKRPLNNGWNQFNEKLFGVKSFKLILRRK